MLTIEKKYHFYAAHRNENLTGSKCANIHGHTYYVTASFEAPQQNCQTGVTVEFSDIDKLVEPIIKELDHKFLIHTGDPLLKFLDFFNSSRDKCEDRIALVEMCTPSSLENLVDMLWHKIQYRTPFRLNFLTIQETTSSSITKHKN